MKTFRLLILPALLLSLQSCKTDQVQEYDSIEDASGSAKVQMEATQAKLNALTLPRSWMQEGEDVVRGGVEQSRTYGSVKRSYSGVRESQVERWWGNQGDGSPCLEHIDGTAITCDSWDESYSSRLTATYYFEEDSITITVYSEAK